MSRRMRRKARKALISVIGVGLLFWAGSQMPIPGVDTGLTFGGVFWSTVFYLLVVLNSGWWFYVLMPWVRNRMVNICLFVVLFIFGSELYFESEGDIPTIGRQVSDYVRETCDSYSPVVVGAACSTAIGYKDNFLIPLIKSFRSLADVGQVRGPEEDRMAFYDLLRDGTNVEIRLLMPYAETRARFPEALEDPRGFLARRVYVAEGMCPDCKVLGNSRSISFCCRVEGPRVVIYDLPTTLLASQRTASRILEIEADDAIERGHLDRLMDKEIDQFEATLRRFLPADGEGRLYASTEDAHGRRYSFVFRDLLDYVR